MEFLSIPAKGKKAAFCFLSEAAPLGRRQEIYAFALDFASGEGELSIVPDKEGFVLSPAGKLRKQELEPQIFLENKLIEAGWDFVSCSNPEIVIYEETEPKEQENGKQN